LINTFVFRVILIRFSVKLKSVSPSRLFCLVMNLQISSQKVLIKGRIFFG